MKLEQMLNSIDHYQYQEIIYLEQYLYLPSSSLYKKLQTLYKDEYQPNERLIFAYNGKIPYDLLAHLQRCVETLHISNCFVCICNTHPETFDLIQDINNRYSSDYDNVFELVRLDIPYVISVEQKHKPLLNPPQSICLRPWSQIYINPQGNVKPCCVSTMWLESNANNINDLTTVYYESEMVALRNEFMSGSKPASCINCWEQEAVGKASHRTNYNTTHKDLILDIDYETESTDNLCVFDLALGSVCNLACRICTSWASSKWSAELIASDIDTAKHKERLKNGRWAESNTNFWYEFEKWLPQTKFLEFAGGEPLINPMHWHVLQIAVDKGYAKDISLRYNTNGTHTPTQKQIKIWQQFKQVKIDISIDDIEQRFEYQRHHAKWHDLVKTVTYLTKVRDTNMSINASVAVNLYNVLYIPELCDWLSLQNFDSVWFNQVTNPVHLNITNLTPDAAEHVITKWNRMDLHYAEQLAPFQLILKKANGKHLQEFIDYTAELDLRRDQSLGLAHSDLADLTK